MAKKKFTTVVIPNTLETMIEYILISSILDRICKMRKMPLEYWRNCTLLNPFKQLLEIKTWGLEWKKQIEKKNEWAAWQWANAKIDKESFTLLKQTINIPKEDMEDYQHVMFTHAMGFFQEWASLKKPIPKHLFTSLLKDLLTKDLVILGNLLSTEFMEPNIWLYGTISRRAWVPQVLRNKVIKQLVNHQMIGLAKKPQNVYDNRKKDVPTIEGQTKIPFLAVICGLINFLIWIRVEIKHRNCLLKNPKKILNSWNSNGHIYSTHSIPRTPKDAYMVPNQSMELNQKPIKNSYNDYILITFPINL